MQKWFLRVIAIGPTTEKLEAEFIEAEAIMVKWFRQADSYRLNHQ